MDCKRIRERLDAYALDALEPDERDDIMRHLATCDACRREAASLVEIAAVFPEALAVAHPMTVPDEVRKHVLQTVTERSSAPAPSIHPASGGIATRPDGPKPKQRWQGPWRLLATGAPLILLVVSLLWGLRLADALDRERDLRAEYVDLLGDVVGQQELVFEVIGFDDTDRLFLTARQPDSTSYGKVFTRPGMPYVVVMAGRLPDAPEGGTFHVWLQSDGHTVFAGELTVDEAGFGILLYTADQPGPTFSTAFVTLQPAGGTRARGTEILRHLEAGP